MGFCLRVTQKPHKYYSFNMIVHLWNTAAIWAGASISCLRLLDRIQLKLHSLSIFAVFTYLFYVLFLILVWSTPPARHPVSKT